MSILGTKRTIAYLLDSSTGVLKDNESGSIDAPHIQDAIRTAVTPHGGMYIVTPAATTCTNQSTMYKVAGTTAATSASLEEVDLPVDNRLRYTGSTTRHFDIEVKLSVTCSANNQLISFQVFADGGAIAHSRMTTKIGTGADQQHVSLSADALLSQNGYVELFVANMTSAGTTVTVQEMIVHVSGHME